MGRLKGRKKGLAFCVSKSHAEDMAARFNEAGLSSTFIHSGLSTDVRAERLSNFKNGKFSLIANVGVLTTGFDAPDLDFIVMARPTRSPSLHIQMLGRGMRPHPSKENCLVLDYGGNIQRLGFVNEVSLPEVDTLNENIPKVKICQSCDAIIAISSQKCKFCQAVVVVKVPKDIVPLEDVYVGDVIKKTPQKQIKKLSKFHVEIKHDDSEGFIFFASKGDFFCKLFYITFSDREKHYSLDLVVRQISTFTTISRIRKYLHRTFKGSTFREISCHENKWQKIWPNLLVLSADRLMSLFKEYEAYQNAITHNNLEINKKRQESSRRFVNRVFTHQQVDCPLGNQGGCFFIVAPRTKKWICTSCKVVTDHKSILESFEGLRPDEVQISQFEFFRTKLLSPDW